MAPITIAYIAKNGLKQILKNMRPKTKRGKRVEPIKSEPMTFEKLKDIIAIRDRIYALEKLCGYDGINANGMWNCVYAGLYTDEEFKRLLDEANEKVRERARAALAQTLEEFAAL